MIGVREGRESNSIHRNDWTSCYNWLVAAWSELDSFPLCVIICTLTEPSQDDFPSLVHLLLDQPLHSQPGLLHANVVLPLGLVAYPVVDHIIPLRDPLAATGRERSLGRRGAYESERGELGRGESGREDGSPSVRSVAEAVKEDAVLGADDEVQCIDESRGMAIDAVMMAAVLAYGRFRTRRS